MLISMKESMQKKIFFNQSFEVVIPDRQKWVGDGPCFEADGSRKDDMVVVGSEVQILASLSL